MKKVFALAMILLLCVSFYACGNNEDEGKSNTTQTEESTQAESEKITANDYVTIDGIYVDSSYKEDDGSSLKMVYMFLTVTAKDKNLQIDSKYTKMKIGESNTYDSDFYKGMCEYAPSYYYSSFIEDVYVGENAKLALTFKIPEGELKDSKEITFSDSSLPVDELNISTDDIESCESIEQLCEKADPEGYAEMADKHSPADEETVSKVKNNLNGYYWTFYVSAGTTVQKQEIEFMAPNQFEMRSAFGSNSGTYEIRKAYIYVTYSSNNATYKIPYEFKDGELILDCATAFSIYE